MKYLKALDKTKRSLIMLKLIYWHLCRVFYLALFQICRGGIWICMARVITGFMLLLQQFWFMLSGAGYFYSNLDSSIMEQVWPISLVSWHNFLFYTYWQNVLMTKELEKLIKCHSILRNWLMGCAITLKLVLLFQWRCLSMQWLGTPCPLWLGGFQFLINQLCSFWSIFYY